MEHHQFQGVQGLDMDVPTPLEAKLFRGVLGKLAFVILQVCGIYIGWVMFSDG